MADNQNDGQEKTEEPSAKRKQESREEGKILSSKELFVFISMAAATAMFAASQNLMPMFVQRWIGYFQFGPVEPLQVQILTNLGRAFSDILVISLLVAVPILVSVLAAQGALGGIIFSTKAMAFKPERINPLAGIGRMFSAKSLVELLKAVLKVGVLGAVAAQLVWELLPVLDKLSTTSLESALGVIGGLVQRLLISLTIGLASIALLDVAWEYHSLTKGMLMSKQELKDEHKQTEGSPEIKGRMRQKQMETSRRVARQQASLSDVVEATAIITNPTHFAVALKYIPGQAGAPTIVSMGRGVIAHEIITRGKDARVTVMQSPLLARALYFTGDIGSEISDQLYVAVAAILAHIHRIDRGEDHEMPEIELPGNLQFNETGQPLKETKIDPK